MKPARIGVIGATGLVGQETLGWLRRFRYPSGTLRALASERSAGRPLTIGSWTFAVECLTEERLRELDLALFATEAALSRRWVPVAQKWGVRCIDGSSAFRQEPSVPLVIPEINGEELAARPPLIASPNCSTTLALLALAPLHRLFGLEGFSASTYQAVSGAGTEGLRALAREREDPEAFSEIFSDRIDRNILAAIGNFGESGFTEEEEKMGRESQKILQQPALEVVATCVRVPVGRAHAVALEARFAQAVDLAAAGEALRDAPGVRHRPGLLPTPLRCAQQEDVSVARLRRHPGDPHRLLLWVVGDQLWAGAALNLVRIANALLREDRPPGRSDP